MDVQGGELNVLLGASSTLEKIQYVLTEVNTVELYKNCARIEDLNYFLGKYNFKFEKIGNKNDSKNMYYIFNQHIDNIEVELKVRDLDNSNAVRALHDYIDNKLDQNLKILMTYAKNQLKRQQTTANLKSLNNTKEDE